mgnify:CR=1 FL=1
MLPDLSGSFLESAAPFAMSALVAAGRMYGFVALFPLFTWLGASGILRFVLAAGLSLPLLSHIGIHPPLKGADMSFAAMLLAKEVMIGAAIGILAGIPLWAAQSAGDIIDFYRGASAANIVDPVNAMETSTFGQINHVFAMAWVVLSGALPLLIEAVLGSYTVWPAFSAAPSGQTGAMATELGALVGMLIRSGLVIAGPILALMLLAEGALLFVARSARQMPVYDLSAAAKNFVLMAAAPLYAFLLATYLREDFLAQFRLLFRVLGVGVGVGAR